jgi:hypothetical protein
MFLLDGGDPCLLDLGSSDTWFPSANDHDRRATILIRFVGFVAVV